MIHSFNKQRTGRLRLLFLLPAFIACSLLSAQLEITGVVTDSVDTNPLVGAYVMLLKQPSLTVVNYVLTDEEGKYKLQVDSSGAFRIKISYLGYQTISRDLVYDGAAARKVSIDIAPSPLSNLTQTVTVSASRPPIIIQGDTTTFAVDHWADVDDQDLEAVLKKMPGFTVAEDGGLSYRGKKIEKVIIDGKEVANVGAALLTRGISADKVATIQVRQRDQDSKLKENLLDANGIMVLDIQLKEDYKYATFGRVRTGAGISPYARPLGYGSVFSLRKKTRIHLLAEYDAYGNSKISIEEIKNLGREAYAAIFNTPADFSRLRQRAEYDRQIYGFDQFTEVEDATVAFSLNTDLGKHLRLFVGSYQNLDASTIGQLDRQRFFAEDQTFSDFTSATGEQQRRFDSKNKIELDYSRDSLKIRYNINGIFATGRPEQEADYGGDAALRYAADQSTYSVYQNFNLSRLFKGGGGFSIDAYQSFSSDRNFSTFSADGFQQLAPFDNPGQGVSINQRDEEEEKILIVNSSVRHPVLFGLPVTFGYRYLNKQIDGERVLIGDSAGATEQSVFNGRGGTLRLNSHLPYASFRAPFSIFNLDARIGYNFYQYPNSFSPEKNSKGELLEYKVTAGMNTEVWSAQLSYQRQVSSFPLAALRRGSTFSRFNVLNVPTTTELQLLPEKIAQFTVNTYALEQFGLVLDGGLVYGETNTSPNILVNNESPTSTQEFAQNPSNYWIATMKEAKVFDRSPLIIRFEQGYIRYRQSNGRAENIGETYKTNFTALLLKSEVRYEPKGRKLNFKLGYDLNIYGFSNELSTNITNQRQQNIDANTSLRMLNDKARIGLDYKLVLLKDATTNTAFNLFGVSARYTLKKGVIRLQADNIFNIRHFERRTINPVLFSIQQRSIFGRAIYFTYQCDI